MNTCDTCKHWADTRKDGTPYKPDDVQRLCNNPKIDGADCYAEDALNSNADYDYGLTTGPKFGCVHHAT
jgi:hypothetical protein